MNSQPRIRRRIKVGAAIGGLSAVGLGVGLASASTGPAPHPTIAQTISVACPGPVQVTPALNTNLISNPGAEATTPYPVGALATADLNESEPDCWTLSGQSFTAGAAMSALPYVPSTLEGQSSKPANPSTPDPNKGTNLFYGGIGSEPTVRASNMWSFATQSIDLSGLRASGQPFSLSGYLGGTTTQGDYGLVSVTFENPSGQPINAGVPDQIGPVPPAQRANATSLVFRQFVGTVPAGASKAVVTIAMLTVGQGGADNDAMADSLNLTVGSSVTAAPTPTLVTEPYSYVEGSAGSLTNPQGISASNGNVYVSNTGDNNVADLNILPDQATGAFTPIFAGSLERVGDSGDGGPATEASLTQPGGTAEDAAGDVFIADTADSVIREVNTNGTITRVAGNGTAGSAGLNGPATKAELDFPRAVAVDSQGDLFIADTNNNRVVEVHDGKLVDFAGNGKAGYSGDGGQATAAQLTEPTAVAIDAVGNVYIADAGNNVIRRVDAHTGHISTVAGDYAADKANDGLGGYSGDGGPARSARLYDPEGIAIDGAGDLFIADRFNNAIREVTPDGTISTVVNSAGANGAAPAKAAEVSGPATASGLNGPTAVAVDNATNTLYIADTSNNDAAAVLNIAKGGNHAGPQ